MGFWESNFEKAEFWETWIFKKWGFGKSDLGILGFGEIGTLRKWDFEKAGS